MSAAKVLDMPNEVIHDVVSTYKCAVCDVIKKDANHWWLVRLNEPTYGSVVVYEKNYEARPWNEITAQESGWPAGLCLR